MSKYVIDCADGALLLADATDLELHEWIDINVMTVTGESKVIVRVELCNITDSALYSDETQIRDEMTDWLEENGYSFSIACDFADHDTVRSAIAEALLIRQRFIDGDYVPLDGRYRVWWTSEDKQGSLDCGDFLTIAAAKASLPDMTAEMLRVGNEDDVDGILAGTFSIEAVRGSSGCGVEERFDVADFAPLAAAA